FLGPIQVRLHQVPFHHCQDYEAISYCWGDSTDTWPIYLDDQVMPIRINLAQALRRYRFQSGSRFIWADAICIDQSNLLERSYHVAMMGEIYQRSQCTLIWLGP
ncbi:heterokaryon incompatibility, partial [Leptodontidium sp. 2 PMI_412]